MKGKVIAEMVAAHLVETGSAQLHTTVTVGGEKYDVHVNLMRVSK